MTHATLKTKIKESIPFTIHIADGRRYEVPHQDFILLPPGATFCVVVTPADDEPDEYVSHTIPLLMVSGVAERTKYPAS